MMNHVDRVQMAKRIASIDPLLPEAREQLEAMEADLIFMGEQRALLNGRIAEAERVANPPPPPGQPPAPPVQPPAPPAPPAPRMPGLPPV